MAFDPAPPDPPKKPARLAEVHVMVTNVHVYTVELTEEQVADVHGVHQSKAVSDWLLGLTRNLEAETVNYGDEEVVSVTVLPKEVPGG